MDVEKIERGFHALLSLQQYTDYPVDPAELTKFKEVLTNLSGVETIRINVIDFAEKADLDPYEALRIFIYGAKVGLFQFEWNFLCPLCGGREHSYENLNQLEKESYLCTLCDRTVEVVADSHLEISFTLNSEISGYTHNPYDSMGAYWAYHFSPSIVWPEAVQKAFDEQQDLKFFALAPGKRMKVTCGMNTMNKWRLISLDSHEICTIVMEGMPDQEEKPIQIEHTTSGFDKKEIHFKSNKCTFVVKNGTSRDMGFIIGQPGNEKLVSAIETYPPYFKPFVTGKMILNNQLFRELFLVDNLPDDLSMKINDITLLFTDLKGSTDLYDRTGDIYAYKLVKRHFKILQKIVDKHNGGIVKTMGDAIMASFNDPGNGIKAANEMLTEIELFNNEMSEVPNALGLKIGIHRGQVIAVKANQTLDYFGQTVNIAARIQNLAGSGEIWISDDLYGDQIKQVLIDTKLHPVSTIQANLKGVGKQIKVHQLQK